MRDTVPREYVLILPLNKRAQQKQLIRFDNAAAMLTMRVIVIITITRAKN